MSKIESLLNKTFEDVKKWGENNGYAVYETYSEPFQLIVPHDMRDNNKRLEVSMYVCDDPKPMDTKVMRIERYENGVLSEIVRIKELDIILSRYN
jgi:hypothetical protein